MKIKPVDWLNHVKQMKFWRGAIWLLVLAVILGVGTAPTRAAIDALSPLAWSYNSGIPGALLGWSVSTAGDVNGDGFDDVIVGAHFTQRSVEVDEEGRAYLFYGSPTGLSSTPSWTGYGGIAGAYFGWSVASAGDVDGDGYSDVVVGAKTYSDGQEHEGKVFVFYGSPDGLSSTADWTVEGDQARAQLGYAVASAGDVNNDGYDDLLAGANLYDDVAVNEGAVFLYYGSISGLNTTPARVFTGGMANAQLGTALAGGDLNNDNYSDLILAAPFYANGENSEGKVFVYNGHNTGPSSNPDWEMEGNQLQANYGSSVAAAGDVDNDGYGDLLVSAENYDQTLYNEGKVFLYRGGAAAPDLAPLWTYIGGEWNLILGHSVAGAGDINGDGFDDIIIGAPHYSNPDLAEGRAFVFFGDTAGPAITPDWVRIFNYTYTALGYSVGGAGDVNGDTYSDIILGAPYFEREVITTDEGLAEVFHGAADGLNPTPINISLSPNPVSEGSPISMFGSFVYEDPAAEFTLNIDWGDGSPVTVIVLGTERSFNVQHSYSDDGEYLISVTASEPSGTTLEESITTTVQNVAPGVTLTGGASVAEGATYSLAIGPVTDPGSDTVSACHLDWGDGTPLQSCLEAIGASLTHSFADGPASRTIRIHLTDEDGEFQNVDTHAVNVNNANPVAVNDAYGVQLNQALVIPAPGVLSNDTDVPADTLTAHLVANVGQGTLALQANGGFTYTPPNNFSGSTTFTYQAWDEDGGISTAASVTLTVTANQPIVANAGPDQITTEGTQVQFAGSYVDPDLPGPLLPANIRWNFGDGSPEVTGSLAPTHTYADNGVYVATLTLSDGQGSTDTDTVQITVSNVVPVVSLGADTQLDLGDPFTRPGSFADQGADTWTATVNYGDGSGTNPLTLTGKSFTLNHLYTSSGAYRVTVTVTDDDGGVGQARINVQVGAYTLNLPAVLRP